MAENFLGEIRSFAFARIPKDWVPCDGRLIKINDNQALFSLLGTTYGGDGQTTFGIPDLRGRSLVHPDVSTPRGMCGGAETVMLQQNNMPAHTHTINAHAQQVPPNCRGTLKCATATPTESTPAGNIIAGKSGRSAKRRFNDDENPEAQMQVDCITLSGSTDAAGGNASHENMSPFLVINYCIATNGIFPSRP